MEQGGLLTMSTQETDQVSVIKQVAEQHLKQSKAMQLLNLSKRQVIRLVKKYRKEGSRSLISKRRGKPSNNRHAEGIKRQVRS